MNKLMGNLIVILITGVMAIWGIGFGIQTMKLAPANAKMFIDTEFNTYLTPPCRAAMKWEHAGFGLEVLEPSTMAEIRARQNAGETLTPDEVCKERRGRVRPDARLTSRVFSGLGKSRWTTDGNWNW